MAFSVNGYSRVLLFLFFSLFSLMGKTPWAFSMHLEIGLHYQGYLQSKILVKFPLSSAETGSMVVSYI